ncbi:hypothetical protein JCM10908_003987 [Rhodotorula pacifica]|uniref:uncharacterized protein n=1 Tax=Rhodotorula pacifica TaxID=1495444 RepID=UPI003179B28D
MATGAYRQSYQPQQHHQGSYQLAQPSDQQQRRQTSTFSNAFLAAPQHNGLQQPVEQQRAYRQSVYAHPSPSHAHHGQVRYSHAPAAPHPPPSRDSGAQSFTSSRVERPPRQASMMLDAQQQKIQMQQFHYEQQQQRLLASRPPLPPQHQQSDRLMASDLSSSSIASNSAPSLSPQPSEDALQQQQQPRASTLPPKRPTAPLCGPFEMDDWTITDATLPSCVSPAVFLLWQTSPLAGRDAFETVFVDAQTRRVAFVAREYVRGADGVLRRGGVEDDETRDLSSSQWHEADGAAADGSNNQVEKLEWLLLSVPSARERERGSDQLGKVGLVTNENLYLPAGKVVRWKKFYKKSFFADEKEEPTWQGIGGTKYRWVVQPGQASMCHLIDHRTKEVIVTVRERSEKPTQIVISALAQPSIQPVLLTLLHRTFTIAEKARNKDRQAWEEEEVVRW